MQSLSHLRRSITGALALVAISGLASAQALPWSQLTPATSPSSRERVGMATDGTLLYLYGGQVNTTVTGYDNLWSFDGTTWTQVTASGASCGPRSNPGMCWDTARGKLVVFGGMGNPWGTRVDDTWEWSASTGWTQVTPATVPGARWLFNMVYVPGVGSVFHGGNWIDPVTNVAAADSATWAFDGTNWSIISTNGPARQNGKLVYRAAQNDLLYIGGTASGVSTANGETWRLDLGTMTWNQLFTATEPTSNNATGAPGLTAPGVCVDAITAKVILHGGQGNGGQPSGLTWEFDGTDWRDVSWNGAPQVRNTELVWMPSLNKAVLACGNYLNTARNQTWTRGPQTYGFFLVSGSDCPTTTGPVATISSNEMPSINSTFDVQFENLTPGTLLAAFVGSSNTTWSGLPLPLPMNLLFPGSGASCSLQVAADFGIFSPTLNVPQTAGTLSLTIPNEPFIVGLNAYVQGLQVEVGASITASNTKQGRIILGRF